MPKRTDIKSVLIIGAGPIIIGQACEFDYSGAQACKALREEGYRVILVNSNPATIMTDPQTADVTYIEPITWEVVERIIAKERPDAILPTMGGQTALNCAMDLARHGVLDKYDIELIGAKPDAIDKAEDRERFKEAMDRIGLESARSGVAYSLREAKELQAKFGFPTVIRPSFTLGGSGGGIAHDMESFIEICERGLELSPTHELLIEESLLGWKEYEMEVVRDTADNCIIVCSIENFDPMGVHTGDSITVAPAQTLTDREYQRMRDASIAILREIGVDTGGSNVQFAVNPETGRMIVIEMNPRVSRSSALASKATGFPIARIAAKLAVGYTLDELRNEITGGLTPASFEPTIDYVVTKVPRFAFEKFPAANDRLTTQMKSVGEVMAIGNSFEGALMKAIRSLELPVKSLRLPGLDELYTEEIEDRLVNIDDQRLFVVAEALRRELDRGGQAYYIHNRIDTIDQCAAKLAELLPGARIATAHGRMDEATLSGVWQKLLDGEIDVLVCTTLIETGVDVRNCNTLIIEDADRMGLAQLYQIRGRVGRSGRKAYAYFTFRRDKVLTDIAAKRLSAIREFTSFGSGFRIAMRDLQIRGAGNLLGERQHGHMEAVGYDLYCKMLNEAVKNLKGEDTAPDFLTTVELEVDAYIPASYIVNEQQKLDIYKRIAGVETESESAEMKEELLDRFGTVPKSVDNLLRIALLRAQAHKLYIMEIKGRPGELRFVYRPDARVHGENIPMLFEQYGNSLKFLPQGNPVFTYQFKRSNVVEKNSEDLLLQAEQMIKDMQRCLL